MGWFTLIPVKGKKTRVTISEGAYPYCNCGPTWSVNDLVGALKTWIEASRLIYFYVDMCYVFSVADVNGSTLAEV